jgi:endonuclease G
LTAFLWQIWCRKRQKIISKFGELEEATRAIVTKQKKDVYVVTGPLFSGKKLKTIGRGVIVPTAVFKAIYLPKHGIIGAYYAPNNNSLQVKVVSVCYLEEQLE